MRILNLVWAFFKIGAASELQYRINFFVQLLQSFIGLATGLIGLGLVFSYTSDLGGWTRPELLAVMGIHILMGGVIQTFIQPNMERLMGEIREGTLDFALTKPADGQFLVSIREFRLWRLVDVIMGLIVLGVAISEIQAVPCPACGNGTVSLIQTLAFIFTLFLGGIMLYCFWLILTTVSFWVVRVDEMVNLFQGLFAAGRWPVGVYPDWLQVGLTFIIPVAFAVTVPAEAIIGRLTLATVLEAAAVTAVLAAVTRYVWNTGVRHYSGASA